VWRFERRPLVSPVCVNQWRGFISSSVQSVFVFVGRPSPKCIPVKAGAQSEMDGVVLGGRDACSFA
jgi:hypothetical protein